MSQCRSCGAEIRWVKTEAGKQMPIDAAPAEDGNIQVYNGVAVYLKAGEPVPYDTPRYKSHFATCPNASKHRKSQDRQ